jgi:hypothetical protein
MTMVKETKIFRQQAEKAERMARATSNEEASESLLRVSGDREQGFQKIVSRHFAGS